MLGVLANLCPEPVDAQIPHVGLDWYKKYVDSSLQEEAVVGEMGENELNKFARGAAD